MDGVQRDARLEIVRLRRGYRRTDLAVAGFRVCKSQIIGNGSGISSDGRSYIWVWSPRLNKSGWVNDSFIG